MLVSAVVGNFGLRRTACSGAVIGADEARLISTSCHLSAALFMDAYVARCAPVLIGKIQIHSIAVWSPARATGGCCANGILAACCEDKKAWSYEQGKSN